MEILKLALGLLTFIIAIVLTFWGAYAWLGWWGVVGLSVVLATAVLLVWAMLSVINIQ